MSVTDRIRQPEYTGENRCLPCTTVNVAIAAGTSLLVALASTVIGTSVFVLSLVTIYFRGYIIPGTPTLTKRYFPERLLRWFDKDTMTSTDDKTVAIDTEQVLLTAGAVEPCREDTDLCLTADFQQAWHERVSTVRTHDLDEDRLANVLGISSGDSRLTIDQQDGAFVSYIDTTVIGQWESQAAIIADIAAATELSERFANWMGLAPDEITRVLKSLRIFIEQCPECDGIVQIEDDVVESCCRSYDVVAATCQDCDARLFEMEWTETTEDDTHTQSN